MGTVVFDGGRPVLSLFSKGWDGVPVERPWDEWISGLALRADVEERRQVPAFLSFQRELRNAELDVSRGVPRGRRPAGGGPGRTASCAGASPTSPTFFARARPHREMEVPGRLAGRRAPGEPPSRPAARPARRLTDFFDLATFGDDGRALHLARRVSRGTPEALAAVPRRRDPGQDRPPEDRRRRRRLPDRPPFRPADGRGLARRARQHHRPLVLRRRGVLHRLRGFVRVGPRRGFHLLLVEEADGGFVPVL